MVQWRDAIQSDTALTILEDDIVVAENFVEETERLIKSLPDDWELVIWGWGFDAYMTFDLLPGYSHCTSTFDQETLRKRSQHFSAEQIESRLFRIRSGFGTIGYSISPRGARRLLDFCMPLRPMSLHYPGYPKPLPNTGIDNMMAQLYPHMAAYVAVPPLVVTDNYHSTSTVQTRIAEPATQLNTEALGLPPVKAIEFILVSQKQTIVTLDEEHGCLHHVPLDRAPLNLCLTLAERVKHSGERIDFEVLDTELVLQPVEGFWVLRQNDTFAVMRADGSIGWERDVEPDSVLHLIPAESARLISPQTELIARPTQSSRRRLLIVAPWLVVGGAEKVNLDLVTGLKAEYEITLVTTQGGGPWLSRFEGQVERLILLGQLMSPQLHAPALAFMIHRLAIDCVLISNSQSGYASLPFLREHFPAMPMFDLIHGQGGKLDGGGYPKFSTPLDPFLTGRIVITDYLRDFMIANYGVAPHRITRIHNGVDLDHFVPVVQDQSVPPIVSFIGRLAPEKQPEQVVAIARELTETTPCRFKIAGDGPLRGKLAEVLAGNRLPHSVELIGHIEDVRALLAETYVLLLTSEMEGLPIVVLEAMAMGVPVICSAVGGIPEMVRDGVEGFLVPCGPNFAAEAAARLQQLLSDPERRAMMGKAARKRAETQFGMGAMMESYRTLLKGVELPTIETPAHNPIQRNFGGNFFIQKLKVRDLPSRIQYLKEIVVGRRVLHVGCTDHPIFDPGSNLHIQLSGDCAVLDGLDVDREGIEVLAQHVPGRYFSRASDVIEHYDVLLVPETIEHVENIREFLTELNTIDFTEIVITAPCLIGWNNNFNYADRAGRLSSLLAAPQDYIEEVHPDHKAWFTPYTLANCIEKFTPWSIEEILFLDSKRMTAVRCTKTALRQTETLAQNQNCQRTLVHGQGGVG